MKRLLMTGAAISALFVSVSRAQNTQGREYYTIDENSVMITEITSREAGQADTPVKPPDTPQNPVQPPVAPVAPVTDPVKPPAVTPGSPLTLDQINTITDSLDKIVNLAEKIWIIIQKNAPVVNTAINYANAVPSGITHWTQLQGWSKPGAKRYELTMKNALGGQAVKIAYLVRYTYGGNLQGKGKFLTGVSVEPLDVQTYWGYTIDLTAEVPDSTIVNVGTHEDPVAAMQIQLKWKVRTAFKELDQKAVYYVQGDGLLQEIGAPFKRGLENKTGEKAREVREKIGNTRFN